MMPRIKLLRLGMLVLLLLLGLALLVVQLMEIMPRILIAAWTANRNAAARNAGTAGPVCD